MRTSTLITGAALAAGAFASPLFKRDVEIDTVYDVAYATVMVTETDVATVAATVAAAVPTTSVFAAVSTSTVVAAAPATSSVINVQHYGHRHSKASSVAPAAVSTSTAVAEAATPVADYASAWTSTWASTWVVTASAESSVVSVAPTTTAAATSAASTTEASKVSSAAAGKATTYQEIVLAHHNVHRANHSADALIWDSDLESTAATIAATCVYAHSMDVNGGGYGQNIAAGVEANNVSAVITELFYNGEVNWYNGLYGEANPDMTNFESWGHFSQLVWKGTTKVGCATQYCSGGLSNVGSDVAPYFTVCNYGTPGNYAGEYAENIGDSLGHSSQAWSYDL